jgi:hypothetical protein
MIYTFHIPQFIPVHSQFTFIVEVHTTLSRLYDVQSHQTDLSGLPGTERIGSSSSSSRSLHFHVAGAAFVVVALTWALVMHSVIACTSASSLLLLLSPPHLQLCASGAKITVDGRTKSDDGGSLVVVVGEESRRRCYQNSSRDC